MGSGSHEDAELMSRRLNCKLSLTAVRVLLFGIATGLLLSAQGREYGRSMVIAQQGIVATSQALASEAGAADPVARWICGGCGHRRERCTGRHRTDDGWHGRRHVLPLSGRYDRQAHGTQRIRLCAARVVPGVLTTKPASASMPTKGFTLSLFRARWMAGQNASPLRKAPLEGSLFNSAIAYADEGFPVSEIIHESWTDAVNTSNCSPVNESERLFLPGGKVRRKSINFKNPGWRKRLRLIADNGPDAFYKGEIAQAILDDLAQHQGGTMTAEDLASFSSEWVEPISIDYRGWRVYELPPNGQGMAALEMLNIMETAPATTVCPRRRGDPHTHRSDEVGLLRPPAVRC